MKILNTFIKIILIIVWSFTIFYIAKALGFSFEPDEVSGDRNMMRVVLGVLILGGAYFIWKINLFREKK